MRVGQVGKAGSPREKEGGITEMPKQMSAKGCLDVEERGMTERGTKYLVFV